MFGTWGSILFSTSGLVLSYLLWLVMFDIWGAFFFCYFINHVPLFKGIILYCSLLNGPLTEGTNGIHTSWYYVLVSCNPHPHHTFTIPSRINDVTAYCHRGRKPPLARTHLLLWVLASRTCHVVLHIRVPSLGHLPKKEINHDKFLHLGLIECEIVREVVLICVNHTPGKAANNRKYILLTSSQPKTD